MSLDVSLEKTVTTEVEVYTDNITHNLNTMAEAAGIYKHLWCPEEVGCHRASHLLEPLREGLAKLEADPAKFRAMNPKNGWGTYEGLCGFVRDYLRACEVHPDANIKVCR